MPSDLQLLCACNCAYGVTAAGYAPVAPYHADAGFTGDPPVGFAAGAQAIDAVLVGSVAEGTVVAFRGTIPPGDGTFTGLQVLLDWMQDFEAVLLSVPEAPGLVHEGFWHSLHALWDPLLAEVKRRGRPVFVTGHSKGGAMATLAAWRFAAEGLSVPSVLTFGSPRAGNGDFAAAYDGRLRQARFEFGDDIIPHLPPRAALTAILSRLPGLSGRFRDLRGLAFQSAGELRYVAKAGKAPVGESAVLETRRLFSLAWGVLTVAGILAIVHDHGIGTGSGYYGAAAKD